MTQQEMEALGFELDTDTPAEYYLRRDSKSGSIFAIPLSHAERIQTPKELLFFIIEKAHCRGEREGEMALRLEIKKLLKIK